MSNESGSLRIAMPKMAELVADKIRMQVARGAFKPGDALPSETMLMKRFGVARPTMREAIRILESDSLLSTRRGSRGGPKVQEINGAVLGRRVGLLLQMNGTTIDDLFEAQSAIEPRAVALAAARRTKADLATLRRLIEQARHVVDLADFAPIAAAFHVALVRASKNKTLTLVVEILHTLICELYRARMVQMRPITKKVIDASVELYESVVDRIEARDAVGAEKVWSEDRPHLGAVIKRLAANDRDFAIYHG